MPRTVITPVSLPGGSSAGVGFQEFTWTAGDATNKNAFVSTGKEMLMIYNSGASTRNVTLYKTAGRIELTLAAGEYASTGQIPASGWRQTADSSVWVDPEHAEVKFAVLVLP